MKKVFSMVIDICILVSVWLLFLLTVAYLISVAMYFPELGVSGSIALISVFSLVIAYTLFWIKRF